MRTMLTTLALVVTFASSALAQTGACPASTATVDNPTWVCVTGSPDHTATNPDGSQKLTRYDLLIFAAGSDPATATPTSTVDLGKPTLNAQGAFWVQRAELAAIAPVPAQHRWVVVAVGPGGTSPRSAISNFFTRTPAPTPPAAPPAVRVVRP